MTTPYEQMLAALPLHVRNAPASERERLLEAWMNERVGRWVNGRRLMHGEEPGTWYVERLPSR